MKTPFEDLLDTLINGQDKAAKAILKSCSRQTRYEFIEWLGLYDISGRPYQKKVIKWCVLGEWK